MTKQVIATLANGICINFLFCWFGGGGVVLGLVFLEGGVVTALGYFVYFTMLTEQFSVRKHLSNIHMKYLKEGNIFALYF